MNFIQSADNSDNMTINYLSKTKFIFCTVLLAALNLGFNNSTVEAKPGNTSLEYSLKISAASTTKNQSSNSDLTSTNGSSDRQQLIPVREETILANSFGGRASWYGPGFHGRLTANGERYNQNAMTAAHPSLRFGTKVQVTNLNNGRSVIVRINDRGPYAEGRVIDLSAAAARSLNMISSGVAPVEVTILGL